MTQPQQIKLSQAKGRPMLQWVGKKAIDTLTAFPARPVEHFNPTGEAAPGNLLLHGDNKDTLTWLIAHGYRRKISLIYIDPPFDSGADYVRKVQLRGIQNDLKVEGEGYTHGEQVQYTDIWANDTYLQFMYERLLLLKELLVEDGSIYLHCDHRRSHHLRCLLDEIFGADNFQNEIVREKQRGGKHHVKKALGSIHDVILHYSNGDNPVWHHLRKEIPDRILMERYPYEDQQGRYALADCRNFAGVDRPNLTYEFLGFYGTWKWAKEEMLRKYEEGEVVQSTVGNVPRRKVRPPEEGDLIQSLWYDVPDNGLRDYPTEKSEALLERIIGLSSNPGDIVLDCFAGSGTCAAVAQKLGRRWIAADINKGAIQTTSKRLQTIIAQQAKSVGELKQGKFLDNGVTETPPPAALNFTLYRINDYDLPMQHNEFVNLAVERIGIDRIKTDPFFDGTLGKELVKIIAFNHPLTLPDLQLIVDEIGARQQEERNIVAVCLGQETRVGPWLEAYNKNRPLNKIRVIELRSDPKYGNIIIHQPAQAEVKIERQGDKITVTLEDFISPTIAQRLKLDTPVFDVVISDWRSMVDVVLIDTAYNGEVFNITLSDVPEKKTDLVSGSYTLPAPEGETTVAVKMIDMLGEEVLVTQTV